MYFFSESLFIWLCCMVGRANKTYEILHTEISNAERAAYKSNPPNWALTFSSVCSPLQNKHVQFFPHNSFVWVCVCLFVCLMSSCCLGDNKSALSSSLNQIVHIWSSENWSADLSHVPWPRRPTACRLLVIFSLSNNIVQLDSTNDEKAFSIHRWFDGNVNRALWFVALLPRLPLLWRKPEGASHLQWHHSTISVMWSNQSVGGAQKSSLHFHNKRGK